jgi:hypothetical protein
MSLFARARAQLNLSPGERALLKLVEGAVLAGIVAALPVVAQLLAQQRVNWTEVARIAGATFAVAALMALAKFYKAQGDQPLEEVVSLAASTLAQKAGVSDVKVPFAPPPVPQTTLSTTSTTPGSS